jgi:hypothetical protein
MSSGLLPEARHLILPKGIRSSGFPAVRETCRRISIEFDRWQQDLNRCLLAKDADGLYAADTAVLSISRQVGKTYDVGAVAFALCIATPNLTVVWTAHRFKVSRESFNEMRAWAKRRQLAAHVDYDEITTGAGNECIPFRNDSRIVFAARERGAIRGFTKVGMLVLDEAQILSEAALSDLVPTTNQAANPLVILMGTPPKPTDPSEVFVRLRQEALAGESDDVLYVELSADGNADPNDRKQWRKANPSYPARTTERAILRLKKLLSADDFLREALGVWPEDGVPKWQVIPEAAWLAMQSPRVVLADPVALGVDVTPDRTWSAVAAAGRAGAGRGVEVLEHRPGTSWVIPRLRELAGRHKPCVVVTSDRAIADEIDKADTARVGNIPGKLVVYRAGSGDMASAASMLFDGVAGTTPDVHHLPDDELSAAVAGATKRQLGDGWAWDRRSVSVNICPLVAVSLALWGHATPRIHVARLTPFALVGS